MNPRLLAQPDAPLPTAVMELSKLPNSSWQAAVAIHYEHENPSPQFAAADHYALFVSIDPDLPTALTGAGRFLRIKMAELTQSGQGPC